MIFSYLSNRTQRFKVYKSFSDKIDIEFGVHYGSVLGLLLFNTDMTDLSYKCEDFNVAGYTDDIIPGDTEIPRLALELQASATKLSR